MLYNLRDWLSSLKKKIVTIVIGGVTLLLPITIVISVVMWVWRFANRLIQPITDYTLRWLPLYEFVASLIVLFAILGVCFLLGAFVRTSLGRLTHGFVEEWFLHKIPFYTAVKQIVMQFLGDQETPFSAVGLADLWGTDTWATVFVTSRCEVSGYWTVFAPTSPNPTSGFPYHIKKERVFVSKISVEAAMRTIISCGAGSSVILAELHRERQKTLGPQ